MPPHPACRPPSPPLGAAERGGLVHPGVAVGLVVDVPAAEVFVAGDEGLGEIFHFDVAVAEDFVEAAVMVAGSGGAQLPKTEDGSQGRPFGVRPLIVKFVGPIPIGIQRTGEWVAKRHHLAGCHHRIFGLRRGGYPITLVARGAA